MNVFGRGRQVWLQFGNQCQIRAQTISTSVWADFGDNPAIFEANQAISYETLHRTSSSVAYNINGELGEAVDTPQRISFLCPKTSSYVNAIYGIFRSGHVAVPLCAEHPSEMLKYYIEDSKSDLVITSRGFADKIRHTTGKKVLLIEDLLDAKPSDSPLDVADGKDALIIYTSGTTGPPKGVVLTHSNLRAQTEAMIEVWKWCSKDCLLHVLPLHHVHGIVNCLLTPLSIGAKVALLDKFDPKIVWEYLLQEQPVQPNLFMAVPTVYSKLIHYGHEHFQSDAKAKDIRAILTQRIRLMVSGSAALPVPVLEKWRTLSGHILLERYGMTEIGMALTNPLDESQRIPGCVGKPFPGVSARIVGLEQDNKDQVIAEATYDDFTTQILPRGNKSVSGELQIKGPNVFKEYFAQPEATAKEFTADGWFKTGDTAFMDHDGVFQILGRTSVDIIKSSGYKISALDVERMLLEHPNINDVAVLGIPDEKYGQQLAGLVVWQDPSGTASDFHKLAEWSEQKMPKYSIPRLWKSIDQLPRNTMGKVNKKELLQLSWT